MIFHDDFKDLTKWLIFKGAWNIIVVDEEMTVLDGVSPGEGLIYAGNIDWTNYTVETPVRIMPDTITNEATVVVRFRDGNNFYWAGLGCWGHRVSISRKIDGVTEELVFDGDISEVLVDRVYNLKVVCKGDLIRLYVDDVLELEVHDSTHPNGAIGYRTYNSHMQAEYIDAYAAPTPLLAIFGLAGIGGAIGYFLKPEAPFIPIIIGAASGGALGFIIHRSRSS